MYCAGFFLFQKVIQHPFLFLPSHFPGNIPGYQQEYQSQNEHKIIPHQIPDPFRRIRRHFHMPARITRQLQQDKKDTKYQEYIALYFHAQNTI